MYSTLPKTFRDLVINLESSDSPIRNRTPPPVNPMVKVSRPRTYGISLPGVNFGSNQQSRRQRMLRRRKLQQRRRNQREYKKQHLSYLDHLTAGALPNDNHSESESEELARPETSKYRYKPLPPIPEDAVLSITKNNEEDDKLSEEADQLFTTFREAAFDVTNDDDEIKQMQEEKLAAKKAEVDKFFRDMCTQIKEAPVPSFATIMKENPQLEKLYKDEAKKCLNNEPYKKALVTTPEEKMATEACKKRYEQRQEMEKDLMDFQKKIFEETKQFSSPQSLDPFKAFSKFAPITAVGDGLLQNADDKATQETARRAKREEKSLLNRLKKVEAKYATELVDNFDETNDQLISPQFMAEEVIKVRNRILSDQSSPNNGKTLVNLSQYCINNYLVDKIEKIYRNKYHYEPFENPPPGVTQKDLQLFTGTLTQHHPFNLDTSTLFQPNSNNNNNTKPSFGLLGSACFMMEKSKLIAVLDHLINKYRCLSEDRRVLDQTSDLGEEISEVVAEYQQLQKKLETYRNFKDKLESVKKTLTELETASKELELVDATFELKEDVLNNLEEFEDQIETAQIEPLIGEAHRLQARFNYYQKMAQEISRHVEGINKLVAPPLLTTNSPSSGLSFADLIGAGSNIPFVPVHSPPALSQPFFRNSNNLQLRSDPPLGKPKFE